jgi:hypothetical protein
MACGTHGGTLEGTCTGLTAAVTKNDWYMFPQPKDNDQTSSNNNKAPTSSSALIVVCRDANCSAARCWMPTCTRPNPNPRDARPSLPKLHSPCVQRLAPLASFAFRANTTTISSRQHPATICQTSITRETRCVSGPAPPSVVCTRRSHRAGQGSVIDIPHTAAEDEALKLCGATCTVPRSQASGAAHRVAHSPRLGDGRRASPSRRAQYTPSPRAPS